LTPSSRVSDFRNAHEVREFSPGDQDKLLPDRLKQCAGRFLDDDIMCERAFIVGRQIADVHCSRYAVRCEHLPKIPQRPSQFLTWSVGFGMH
jgi:hypothetical protein